MVNSSAPTPFDQGLFLVHLNRGMENFERRNFDVAERELEAARRMRPSDQRVLNLLGLVYFKQEKYTESAGIYQTLIHANPDSYILHFNHGLICFKTGLLDEAEAAFLKALELKPDNQKINFYLGNIYERKGQLYNAIFQYRKAGAHIMVKRVQSKLKGEKESSAASHGDSDASQTEDDTRPPQWKGDTSGDQSAESSPPSRPAGTNAHSPTPIVSLDEIDPEHVLAALSESDAERGTESSGRVKAPKAAPSVSEEGDTLRHSSGQTVVRLTDPIVADRPLDDVTKGKTVSTADAQLFSNRSRPPKDTEEDTVRLRVPPIVAPQQPVPGSTDRARLDGGERDPNTPPKLYSQLRRRDDSFRYLENNLMEINFAGKIFIKQGTIYSYSGNLTFWVKPQRDEATPPLVIVSGTGRLLLTDQQRDITVLQVKDEVVFVEPSHLLACQETLTPRYAVIEREGISQPRLHVLGIEGTGLLALSVRTTPLMLTVTPAYPVNVASANVISWSGELQPTLVEDEALAELMFPHLKPSVNIRLEGSGKVMMEKRSS